MDHFGPFWPKELHFGPFRSANRTLAIPDCDRLRLLIASDLTALCNPGEMGSPEKSPKDSIVLRTLRRRKM